MKKQSTPAGDTIGKDRFLKDCKSDLATTAAGDEGVRLEGTNSFTEGQAQDRVLSAGYANVSALAKDDKGIWLDSECSRSRELGQWLQPVGSRRARSVRWPEVRQADLSAPLVDAGVPEEHAHVNSESMRRGGTLISVRVDDARVDAASAILDQYQPVDPDRLGSDYRKSGWKKFDPEAGPYEVSELEVEGMRR